MRNAKFKKKSFSIGKRNISVSYYDYISSKVPYEFNGYNIVQLSDIHNDHFSGGFDALAAIIKTQSPDIIVITGDLIYRRKPDIDTAISYITYFLSIAPVYFTPGNHEFRSGLYDTLLPELISSGVKILDDSSVTINKNGADIIVAGLRDPSYLTMSSGKTDTDTLIDRNNALSILFRDKTLLSILLSHRPEFFNMYVDHGIDLVFTGHAHGGEIRIPFIGGLFSPGQGFFPKYTSGLHKRRNTTMIVNRGLADNTFPPRIFNTPEIIVVTLTHVSPS